MIFLGKYFPRKPNKNEVKRFQTQLSGWYRQHHRQLPWRETVCPYHIWVSEVMLQQTQVKTVLSYYHPFLSAFPDVAQLAGADVQAVLKAWEGLGYYARARNLHKAAQIVCDRHNGRVPSNPVDFKKLPGAGDYITAAVQSIAFQQPLAAVDGNVKRVLARLNRMAEPVNQSSSYPSFLGCAARLLDKTQPGQFNQAMMELGATVCRPQKPECGICPVQFACLAFRENSVAEYPRRIPSKPIPEHHIAVGVVSNNGRLLITRRADNGLLGGLWEFPGGKVRKDETAEAACVREIMEELNLQVRTASYITRIKHAYTHFKIVMDVFHCIYLGGRIKLNGPVDYKWITPEETGNYPFPKANHKFMGRILKMFGDSD